MNFHYYEEVIKRMVLREGLGFERLSPQEQQADSK